MSNRGNIKIISKEFNNNQLESTAQFGTFSSKDIFNQNKYFINTDINNSNNQRNIVTKYDRIFSETNPKKINNNNNINNIDIESSNLSIENIKFLPNYFLDIEEALIKSNNNVRELKETVKQKIIEEKKLKSIIEQLKLENNKLLKINEEMTNKINKYETNIKKFKNMHGLLETEINNDEDIKGGLKILQNELKKMQEENNNLININKKLKNENYIYINEIKKLKINIKQHLYEKLKFVQTNSINKEQKILNNKLNDIINDNKKQIRSLSKENDKLKNIEKDYKYLSNNYKKICDDNTKYKEKIIKKENIEKNFEELKEKYDKEKFENICKINIWKNNFLEIAKYKLLNYNPNFDQNLIHVIKIEENYINNAPNSIKKLADKILNFFKELIDLEAKYNKDNKNNNDIEKINILNNKENEEKKIRRKILYKYLNLGGNISIICNLKFSKKENKEMIIDKNSQLDTYIIDRNSLIVKTNSGNNDLKKFEFDYIFSDRNKQQELYEEISPLIHTLFKGGKVIIISYGQKKSENILNILDENNNIGILGRGIQEIFCILNEDVKKKYSSYDISLNIFSILNNDIYNLLDESYPKMTINENDKGEMIIKDLVSINIKSLEEFDKLYKLAKKIDKESKNNSYIYIYSFNIKLIGQEHKITQTTLSFIEFEKEPYNKEKKYDKDTNIIEENNIFFNNYLFRFLAFLNNNNINDFKDWNKNILIHYLKSYVTDNKYKILLLLNIDPSLNELEENLKTLNSCQEILSKNNLK